MPFIEDFILFLRENDFVFEQYENVFYFPLQKIEIELITLKDRATKPVRRANNVIYLFEDRWYSCNTIIKKRIAAHLGKFVSIFARKCVVSKIDSSTAEDFFEKYHSYGNAKSKYRYGLYFENELVAAAAFSHPRPIPRIIEGKETILQSYEWVRYASLPDLRVSGGMGKLLKKFIEEQEPDEIMSYADKEWSEGDAYIKLGFFKAGERPSVCFIVNKQTFERISQKKILNDRSYKNLHINEDDYMEIQNMGSIKYLFRP